MKEGYITADGSFFDDMRAKELRILKELGDNEALEILKEAEEAARKEYEQEKEDDTP